MPNYPGSGVEQAMPESLRPVAEAIVTAADDGALLEALRHFKAWEFEEKADLYDWKDVLDRLDRTLARVLVSCPHLVLVGVKPEVSGSRVDQELSSPAQVTSSPAYQEALGMATWILSFTALLLRNAINKHVYYSGTMMSEMLGARDDVLASLALEVVYLLLVPPPTHLQTRSDTGPLPPGTFHGDRTVARRLLALAQGWGSKSQGLGISACLGGDDASLPSRGGDVHLDFVVQPTTPPASTSTNPAEAASSSSSSSSSSSIVTQIRLTELHKDPRSSADIFLSTLLSQPPQHKLPPSKHFSLLSRIRLAKAFGSRAQRRQAVCRRLEALTALVYCHPHGSSSSHSSDAARASALLQSQPELIHELIDLVRHQQQQQPEAEQQGGGTDSSDDDTLEVGLLVLDCLAALAVSRLGSRSVNVLQELGVQRGQYTGLLPSLFRYAEIALTSSSTAVPSSRAGGGGGGADMDLAVGMAFVEATGGGSVGGSSSLGDVCGREERELLWLEAVMGLISAVVTLQPGAAALTECGLVPALLNMVGRGRGTGADGAYSARRNMIVAHAVAILETVIITSSVGLATFREIDAATVVVTRLHEEIKALRRGVAVSQQEEENDEDRMDVGEEATTTKQEDTGAGGDAAATGAAGPATTTGREQQQDKSRGHRLSPSTPPSIKVLLHALLTLLSTAFQSAGSTHIQGATEGSQQLRTPALTESLIDIISNMSHLNGILVSRAAALVADVISNDPSVVSYVHSSGLAKALLTMLCSPPAPSLPPCGDLLRDAPSVLATLSINTEGLEAVKTANPFPSIIKALHHPAYVLPNSRAMLSQTPDLIGQRLEDLMSTHASLKPLVMKELLSAIRVTKLEGDKHAGKPETDPDRWRFLQYVSNIGRVLSAVLIKPDRVGTFVEGDGAEAIADLLYLSLPPNATFFSTLSTGPNPSLATLIGNYPAASALGSAFKVLTQHDPSRLLKRLVKILRAQLDKLADQRDKVKEATAAGGAPGGGASSSGAASSSAAAMQDEDGMDQDSTSGDNSASSTSGGKPSVLATDVLKSLPGSPVHTALAEDGYRQWLLEENAAYFKRAFLVDWLTSWLAVVIKQGAHPRSQPPRGWSSLMDKEGSQVMRHLRALHQSVLKEVCWARVDNFQNQAKRALQRPPGAFLLRVSREEGVSVRDGPEPGDSVRVRTLEFGTILEASERRSSPSGAIVYKTEYGWITVSDDRPRIGTREERRGAVEVIAVCDTASGGGREESKEEGGSSKLPLEKVAAVPGLRLTGGAILGRLQVSYRNVMTVLGRALLASAGRWANRTWEDGTPAGQHVETIVDLLRSSAAYLLDEVDKPDEEAVAGGLSHTKAFLLAEAVDLISAMILDEKRERSIQLNSYLVVVLEREAKGKILTRLMTSLTRLLEYGLARAEVLEKMGPAAPGDDMHKLEREAVRDQVNSALSPVLTLFKRLSSRQLILESQFLPPPRPTGPGAETAPKEPTNVEELARSLHVFMAEKLLPLWQAQSGRVGRLPPDVLEKVLDAMRDLLKALEDEATPLTGAGATAVGGSLSGRAGRGGPDARGPLYAAHSLMEALARDLTGGVGGHPAVPPPEFVPDEAVVTQMMDMGFGRAHVLEALRATGSNRPELAMDYLLTHPAPPEPDPATAAATNNSSSNAAAPAPAVPPAQPGSGGSSAAPPPNPGGDAPAEGATATARSSSNNTAGGAEAGATENTGAEAEGKMEEEDDEDSDDDEEEKKKEDEEEKKRKKQAEEEAACPWNVARVTSLRDQLQCTLRDIAITAVEEAKPSAAPSSAADQPATTTHQQQQMARVTFVVAELLLDLILSARSAPPSLTAGAASTEAASIKRRVELRDDLIHSLVGRVKGAIATCPPAPPLAGLMHLLVLLLQAFPLEVRRGLMHGPDPLPDVVLAALSRDRGDGRALTSEGQHWAAWVGPALLFLDLLAQPSPQEQGRNKKPGGGEEQPEKEGGAAAAPSKEGDATAMDVVADETATTTTTTEPQQSAATAASGKKADSASAMKLELSRLEPVLTVAQREAALGVVMVLFASRFPTPDALLIQAALQLLSSLLFSYALVPPFVNGGGLTAILDLPKSAAFSGHSSLVLAVLKRVLEEPSILQQAMEAEIRATFTRASPQRKDQLTVREFLNTTGPLACRDLNVFLEATSRTVEVLTLPGGRGPVVRLKTGATPPPPPATTTGQAQQPDGGAVNSSSGTSSSGKKGGAKAGGSSSEKKAPAVAATAAAGPPKVSPWAVATMSQMVSLLVGKVWEQYHKMEEKKTTTGGSSSSQADEQQQQASFLSLVDLLEVMSGLSMAFPQIAAGLQRSPLPSPADSFPIFLLYTLLPTPRLALATATTTITEPRALMRIKAAQMAARLLVVLSARSGEARRRIVAELTSALRLESPYAAGMKEALRSSKAEGADEGGRERVMAALHSWAELVFGLADPRATPSKPHDSSSTLSWEVVRIMRDNKMALALAEALRQVPLTDITANIVVSTLLRPMEILTRKAVEDHLAKTAAPPAPATTATSAGVAMTQAAIDSAVSRNNQALLRGGRGHRPGSWGPAPGTGGTAAAGSGGGGDGGSGGGGGPGGGAGGGAAAVGVGAAPGVAVAGSVAAPTGMELEGGAYAEVVDLGGHHHHEEEDEEEDDDDVDGHHHHLESDGSSQSGSEDDDDDDGDDDDEHDGDEDDDEGEEVEVVEDGEGEEDGDDDDDDDEEEARSQHDGEEDVGGGNEGGEGLQMFGGAPMGGGVAEEEEEEEEAEEEHDGDMVDEDEEGEEEEEDDEEDQMMGQSPDEIVQGLFGPGFTGVNGGGNMRDWDQIDAEDPMGGGGGGVLVLENIEREVERFIRGISVGAGMQMMMMDDGAGGGGGMRDMRGGGPLFYLGGGGGRNPPLLPPGGGNGFVGGEGGAAAGGPHRLDLFPTAPATATAQLDRAPAPHPLLGLGAMGRGGRDSAGRVRLLSSSGSLARRQQLDGGQWDGGRELGGFMFQPQLLFAGGAGGGGREADMFLSSNNALPLWMGGGGGMPRGAGGNGGGGAGGARRNWLPGGGNGAGAGGGALNDFAAALEGALNERAVEMPSPTLPAPTTRGSGGEATRAGEGAGPTTNNTAEGVAAPSDQQPSGSQAAAPPSSEAQQPPPVAEGGGGATPARDQQGAAEEEAVDAMATEDATSTAAPEPEPQPMEVASPSPSEQSAAATISSGVGGTATSSEGEEEPASTTTSSSQPPPPLPQGEEAPPPASQEGAAQAAEGTATAGASGNGLVCPPGMDPEAFAELPEEIQREVVREYEASSGGGRQGGGSSSVEDLATASGLDPEALAALPEDIRAEVMAQEARERRIREEAAARPADPSNAQDMDNASFLASLTPDLREEILQQANDELLSTLPPNLVAEAQVLRERAALRRDRDLGVFMMGGAGGGGGAVRQLVGGAAHLQYVAGGPGGGRGAGGGAGGAAPSSTSVPVKPGEVRLEKDRDLPLGFAAPAIKALLRLLFLTTSLRPKHVLSRVILNLCTDKAVRAALLPALVHLLTGKRRAARKVLSQLGVIKDEGGAEQQEEEEGEAGEAFPPSGLMGFASSEQTAGGVVDEEGGEGGVPALAARQTLELLHYLCQAQARVRYEMLTCRTPPTRQGEEEGSMMDVEGHEDEQHSALLVERVMDLLNRPMYTTSSTRLEGLLVLLDSITAPLASYQEDEEEEEEQQKEEEKEGVAMEVVTTTEVVSTSSAAPTPPSDTAAGAGGGGGAAPSTTTATTTTTAAPPLDVSTSGSSKRHEVVKMPAVVVSEARLRLLCSVLREEGCSDSSSHRVNKIAQHLARVPANRLTLLQELLAVAGALGQSALTELSTLRTQLTSLLQQQPPPQQPQQGGSSSSDQAAGGGVVPPSIPASVVTLSSKSSEVKLLRVLQTVSGLLIAQDTATSGSKKNKKAGKQGASSSSAANNEVVLSDMLARLGLEQLWDELSRCLEVVAVLEGVAGADATRSDGGHKKPSLTSSSSMAGLLARLLPVVEAFFVVNSRELALKGGKKDPEGAATATTPSSSSSSSAAAAARQSATASSSSQQEEAGAAEEVSGGGAAGDEDDGESKVASTPTSKGLERAGSSSIMPSLSPELQRVREFVELHRLLLNALLRQNPGLLEKSLAPLVSMPACRIFLDFDNKKTYFRSQIAKLKRAKYRRPMLQLRVRRPTVYHDSYAQLSIRNAEEMRGKLQISFYGEEGIDAGGLTREWYSVMAREMFNQNYALFTAAADGATYQPNPLSGINPDHLSHFRFIGRIIGKALCDEQLLDAHFTRSFYKHILGVPVTHHDMEAIDPDYYKSLCKILEYPLEVLGLDLTFSCEAEEVGVVKIYDIKPNGRNIPVTDDNKMEYIQLITQFRMTNAIRTQIDSFLSGLHDLVPKDLISIFTPTELELLSCGLPDIDLDDLQANTEYFHYRPSDKEIQWLWNILRSFTQEHKALFLQFVTGTSRVPVEGFKALQGLHGVQRFNIHRVFGAEGKLPQGHTCFNQLDLPEYRTEEEMRHKLVLAMTECSEGFGFA